MNWESNGLQIIKVKSKSESVKTPTTQVASEKVANMVGTFLNDDSDSLQIIKITIKSESVKVPNTQAPLKKVTNMVGTFLPSSL